MGAPGPFSNASSDITEWLPLLGSIVQALCGGEDKPPVEGAQAAQNAGKIPSEPTSR
jgi:hypothetical protein